jgi:hypothetical protein
VQPTTATAGRGDALFEAADAALFAAKGAGRNAVVTLPVPEAPARETARAGGGVRQSAGRVVG